MHVALSTPPHTMPLTSHRSSLLFSTMMQSAPHNTTCPELLSLKEKASLFSSLIAEQENEVATATQIQARLRLNAKTSQQIKSKRSALGNVTNSPSSSSSTRVNTPHRQEETTKLPNSPSRTSVTFKIAQLNMKEKKVVEAGAAGAGILAKDVAFVEKEEELVEMNPDVELPSTNDDNDVIEDSPSNSSVEEVAKEEVAPQQIEVEQPSPSTHLPPSSSAVAPSSPAAIASPIADESEDQKKDRLFEEYLIRAAAYKKTEDTSEEDEEEGCDDNGDDEEDQTIELMRNEIFRARTNAGGTNAGGSISSNDDNEKEGEESIAKHGFLQPSLSSSSSSSLTPSALTAFLSSTYQSTLQHPTTKKLEKLGGGRNLKIAFGVVALVGVMLPVWFVYSLL
jgi:hypothetical protein